MPALLDMPVVKPKALLADKGYDGDAVREDLLLRGILPIIPPKANRREPPACDFRRYRDRNHVAGRTVVLPILGRTSDNARYR